MENDREKMSSSRVCFNRHNDGRRVIFDCHSSVNFSYIKFFLPFIDFCKSH